MAEDFDPIDADCPACNALPGEECRPHCIGAVPQRCTWDCGADPASGCDEAAVAFDDLCVGHAAAYAALMAGPPGE